MYSDLNHIYKKDFKYIGQKKYRNSSKSRSRTKRSDSDDYSNSYKNAKMKNEDKGNSTYKQRYNNKNYENRHYNNDDNKSTDFSSRKSHY